LFLALDGINSIKTPNILFVAHHPISGQWVGGIEVYLANIAKALSQKYDIFIYTPKMDSHGLASQIIDSDGKLVREISYSTPYSNWQLNSPEREQAFVKILDELEIDLVHFLHLLGHPPSLITVANQKGIPTVFSAHDFFSVCHVSNLLNEAEQYCRPDVIPISRCDTCLSSKYGILPGSQLRRRNAWANLLGDCDALIFNTEASRSLVTDIYPEIRKHPVQMIAPVPITTVSKNCNHSPTTTPLKVAILGNFIHHKGADTIVQAIKVLSKEAIEFHIFGMIEESYLNKLDPFLKSTVILHGAYSSLNIPDKLRDCQITLHTSICPETYCLTLSEAVDAGLVPVVTNIGALSERVNDRVNGLKIEVESANQLCDALRSLAADPEWITRLRNGVPAVPISRLPEHLTALLQIYNSVLQSKKMNVVNNRLSSQTFLESKDQLSKEPRENSHWALFPTSGRSKGNWLAMLYGYYRIWFDRLRTLFQ